MKIWLHRRNRKTWMFESSMKYGGMVFITSRKTVYKIFWGPIHIKPCWIGQIDEDAHAVFTVENILRASYLEFENGAKYIFPGGV